MIFRAIKYSIIGAGTLGTFSSLHANDYNLNSLGIVRLGRSAITVFDVAVTYKKELYFKDWDKSTSEYKEQKSKVHTIAAKKLLALICTNKGVYIKIGQHVGALDYLLPKEYVQTMKILHSNAPKNPVEDLFKVIRQELNSSADEIFESFESEPLGTASLAQVHKAKLKNGNVVAVKVQHPYVKGNSTVDMKTMEILVNVMSYVFPDFKIKWLVEESKKNLPLELDFLNEGKNAEKVSKMFQNFEWLKIPKIYWELSTPRVLVMEYLEGGQVNDVEYLKKNDINPFDVTNKLGRLYANMIFINGFVHSDPHPGNILVKKNTFGHADIILLDHGLYANLADKFRYDYSKLWLSILNVDRSAMKEHSSSLGIKGDLYGLFACMVTGRPWETVVSGINKIKYTKEEKDLLQNNTALVLPNISDVLEQVDRQMLLILKTNDLIRGIESTLKTQNRMTSFWVMSKCCVQSAFTEERRTLQTRWSRLRSTIKERWCIFKLNVYYIYLGLINFGIIESIKQCCSSI